MTKAINTNTALTACAWYADILASKAWPQKFAGDKPTSEQLDAAHKIGCKPGKQALAIAMALRDTGLTRNQMIAACGNPQFNKLGDMIKAAYLKRMATPNVHGHTVYKVELTAKGKARIATMAKREADLAAAGEVKAAAKAASKPRKVKAAKPDTGTVLDHMALTPMADLAATLAE